MSYLSRTRCAGFPFSVLGVSSLLQTFPPLLTKKLTVFTPLIIIISVGSTRSIFTSSIQISRSLVLPSLSDSVSSELCIFAAISDHFSRVPAPFDGRQDTSALTIHISFTAVSTLWISCSPLDLSWSSLLAISPFSLCFTDFSFTSSGSTVAKSAAS